MTRRGAALEVALAIVAAVLVATATPSRADSPASPSVEILKPLDGTTVNARVLPVHVRFASKASTGNGLAHETGNVKDVMLFLDDQIVAHHPNPPSEKTGTVVLEVELDLAAHPDGPHVLRPRACQAEPHAGHCVDGEPVGILIDRSRPVIELEHPSREVTVTREDSIELVGRVTSTFEPVDATVLVDGLPNPLPLGLHGAFSVVLPLQTVGDDPIAVETAIHVEATDAAGLWAERPLVVLHEWEHEKEAVIVGLEPGTPPPVLDALNLVVGAWTRDAIEMLDAYLVGLPPGMTVEEAILHYEAAPEVVYAEPNHFMEADRVPNDPLYARQVALSSTGWQAAWDVEIGRNQVVVALIDSGFDHLHPDLIENLWINQAELPPALLMTGDLDGDGLVTLRDANLDLAAGGVVFGPFGVVDGNGNGYVDGTDLLGAGPALLNGWDDDFNGYADDLIGFSLTNIPPWELPSNDPMEVVSAVSQGHGTAVAGIIGSRGDNLLGTCGGSWNVSILPLRIENRRTGAFDQWAASSALAYAIGQGARVANCSFSWYPTPTSPGLNLLTAAFQRADALGMFVAASAGNRGLDVDGLNHLPGNLSTTLEGLAQVAGLNARWDLATLGPNWYASNFGPTTVNVAAPGSTGWVYSTRVSWAPTWYGGWSTSPGPGQGRYGPFFGTSSAAPHVSALAALVLSRNPGLPGPAVRSVVLGPEGPGWDGCTWCTRVQGARVLDPNGATWRVGRTLPPRTVVAALGNYAPGPGFQDSDVRLFDPLAAYVQVGSFEPMGSPQPGIGKELASGDLDGDGVDELVFATQQPGFHELRVTDASGNLLGSRVLKGLGGLSWWGLTLATANVHGRDDEILLVTPRGDIEVWRYDSTRAPGASLRYSGRLGRTFSWRADVAAGDVDFDGFDEVVIAEPEVTGVTAPWVDVREAFGGTLGRTLARIFPYALGTVSRLDVAVADLDGDGRSEIVTVPVVGAGPIEVFDDRGTMLAQVGWYAGSPGLGEGRRVAAGDVDNDGLDELLVGQPSGMVEVHDWSPFFGSPFAAPSVTSFVAYGTSCPAPARVTVVR